MATNVIMPKLGMTMTEGTIIKWHKKVGDAIEEGMPLFDVETDKLTNTVNANVSGTLLKISVPEDGTADCLAVVAVIGSEGGKLEAEPAPAAAAEPAAPQTAFSAQTAATIRGMMAKVVEEGTGQSALPAYGGAGGKTGTAETGWVQSDKAVVQSWFAGYYPEEEPRYVMAVIAEDTNNTGSKAAPVFKQICDKIYELEQSRANAS